MTINTFEMQSKNSLDIMIKNEDTGIIEPQPSRNVQAYAKLEFDAFSFYIQTLQVIIGRKVNKLDQVDVHIGSTKAISRQHAKLFYDFTSQRFEIFVMGKNGAFINEEFVECGQTIPLYDKTKIQIGKVLFTFLLPKSTEKENTENRDIRENQRIEKSEFSQDISLLSNSVSTERSLVTYPNINLELSLIKTDEPDILPISSRILNNETLSAVNSTFHDESLLSHAESFNVSMKEHSKPNLSYASLIAQAILSSPSKKMTLSDIYEWITDTYKYYKYAQNGWQNSIRHSLSLNKAFKKVSRRDDEPGKGSFWMINSEYQCQFEDGIYKRNRKSIISSYQHLTTPSIMADGASRSTADSIPIAIMQDGQLALNPEYFNTVNDSNDSNKIQIVQAIVFLQRYIITQLGPHAKIPQNAAAIANALIVALDQQLQKHQNHKNFISNIFKNLTFLLPNTNEKMHTSLNEFSTENKQYITNTSTSLEFITQIPKGSEVSKEILDSSVNQSYSFNDKLVSKELYPIQVPPPPPYYSKPLTSSTENNLSLNSIEKKELQFLSSKSYSINSESTHKQGLKRPHEG
ncbi:hypothetical protein PNEG_01841 [Pneumocystis murina B123]|uniref:Fork-head domain-containing protein n=1 Tax=Pneumocystis murina (strain B123) TaxID=1069680 RepID=M7NSJ1_PNEMU|nr:hypothetical protein PNEG_01841 [Pneumocystis murina B123]EMR10091.1 hypothetical protein PNEG_01841 [Pneumocystis murina B123]